MKRPRRVLFLTEWYPTEENPVGGIFVREHARAAALSSEVAVIHWRNDRSRSSRARFSRDETETAASGLETYRLESDGTGLPADIRAAVAMVGAYRGVRKRGFEPDVIHAHIFRAAFYARLLGRIFRLPVVATEQWSAFALGTLNAHQLRVARIAFRGCAYVLPVSRALEQAIAAHGIEFRSRIVPNVADTAVFSFRPRATPDRSGGKLLFVGTLTEDDIKGLGVLLDAVTQSGSVVSKLDVVGSGPGRASFERMAAQSGLDDMVTFQGLLPKSRVAELMSEADFLVAPSRYDNLPCVVAEALVSGLPVVGSRVGGIPEMVGAQDGVLVDPEDSDALAEALRAAIAQARDFDRSGIAARAVTRYGMEHVGEQLDRVYADALAGEVKSAAAARPGDAA